MKLKHALTLFLSLNFNITQTSQKLIEKSAPVFHSQAVSPDGTICEFNLQDYIGQNIVLYFYPMDNTPGCTAQAKKFRDEISRLQDKKIMVVGISPDPIKSHKKFQKSLNLPYLLVSDTNKKFSISKKYNASGFLFGKRITYLINKDGKIFKIFDHVDIQSQIDDILNAFAIQR